MIHEIRNCRFNNRLLRLVNSTMQELYKTCSAYKTITNTTSIIYNKYTQTNALLKNITYLIFGLNFGFQNVL